MGVCTRLVVIGLAATLLALPVTASGEKKPAAEVDAAGNPFSGGLKFDPKVVTVKVGQAVRWTNTDAFVPHTATENHHLWNLTGDYGIPGAMGFGPGEQRQRTFEAGTERYFCEVHPDAMRAVVRVPVTIAVTKVLGGGRSVALTWAPAAAGKNRVFDVQVKRGSGGWKSFRTGTTKPSGKIARQGTKILISVRARLRGLKPAAATDWSPVASVKA
jgi:plastocyanin